MKSAPLEKRVKSIQPRSDFVSDRAHVNYLNGIAGLVFMQFLHERDAKSAVLENSKKPEGSGVGRAGVASPPLATSQVLGVSSPPNPSQKFGDRKDK